MNDAKEAAMRGDRAQRVNILALVDALEREMGRVAEARPRLPAAFKCY